MDNASVSKGVFVHKGAYKIGNKKTKFEQPDYINEPWHLTYKETWDGIQNAMEDVRLSMFQEILNNLESFVSKVKDKPIEQLDEIQAAIVLAGDKIKYIFRVFFTIERFLK